MKSGVMKATIKKSIDSMKMMSMTIDSMKMMSMTIDSMKMMSMTIDNMTRRMDTMTVRVVMTGLIQIMKEVKIAIIEDIEWLHFIQILD